MKTWIRSALTISVLMVLALFIFAPNIGPIELGIWTVALITFWLLCWVGGRSESLRSPR